MFPVELKKVFDTAVKHSIEQIPALTSAFKEGEFDLKSQIDNEMDFYLGCVIANIFERYMVYARDAGFTEQQILSPTPFIIYNIFQ